ncbi:MAG: beta-ketoacyl synthase N-terminal-like domain-containing protein, partial [Thermoflexibacteraceae bacterium]
MKTARRVVVTGLGALTPIGNTVEEYWDGLVQGKSGAASIKKFDTTHYKTKFACEVKNLNVEDFIEKKEARRIDPFTQYAIIAADQAMKDAGFDLEKTNRDRFG